MNAKVRQFRSQNNNVCRRGMEETWEYIQNDLESFLDHELPMLTERLGETMQFRLTEDQLGWEESKRILLLMKVSNDPLWLTMDALDLLEFQWEYEQESKALKMWSHVMWEYDTFTAYMLPPWGLLHMHGESLIDFLPNNRWMMNPSHQTLVDNETYVTKMRRSLEENLERLGCTLARNLHAEIVEALAKMQAAKRKVCIL